MDDDATAATAAIRFFTFPSFDFDVDAFVVLLSGEMFLVSLLPAPVPDISFESFLDFFLEDVELEVVKVGEKEVLDEEEVLGGKTSPSTSPTSASAFLFFGGIFYRNPIRDQGKGECLVPL